MRISKEAIRFDWDKGNIEKNLIKHKVVNNESEEVFFDKDKKVFFDEKHSKNEKRYTAFGKTLQGRLLVVVYSERKNKIRIISARDMKKKERKIYEKRIKITQV